MSNTFDHKRCVCIVTGSSKGLGRSIALQFSKKLPHGSIIALLSRNEDLMKEVAVSIEKQDGIKAVTQRFDQSVNSAEDFGKVLENCMEKAGAKPNDFDQAILVNNAASLETLDFIRNLDEGAAISEYFQTNLTGCITLTAKFLQMFDKLDTPISRFVINISSLAALQPMNSWSLYCMAKAARDMMMKVLSSEEPDIRTLNYAPGPLPTDMIVTASKDTKDEKLKQWFKDQIENKSLVNCDDSAQKLIAIIEKNTFENAAHIDFYDEI